MTAGQAAIDAALAHGDPQDVTEAVKEAVAQEISEVNADISVHKTAYFNHSYVPDLVAWWGPRDEDHREVFLRFDAADPQLANDIERLDTDHPMFFSLARRRAEETSTDVTEALSRHRQVMVTGADALDALAGTPADSFESLVSTAIVQSGRGLIDGEEASKARADTADGIEAALLADEPRTRTAVSTAKRVLMDAASRRVEKYLQMLWLAGGGELDAYPGTTEASLDVGAEDVGGLVRLVLRSDVVDNPEYWRRLGSMVTLDVLEGLGAVEPSANLQRLVDSNAERLQVSYAAASRHDPRLGSANGAFQWFVAESRLRLDGPQWTISFTDDGRHFRGLKRDQALISVDEVMRRSTNYAIEAVGLDDENLVITVEPKDGARKGDGVAVEQLAEAIGSTPRVRTVTVRNGAPITVEFDRLVAGIERGRISLPLLAEVALDLMTKSSQEEREGLRAQLGAGASSGLFDG